MLSPVILDIAALLMGLGLIVSVISSRAGSISLGVGSVAVGLVLLSSIPSGWEIVGVAFFGMIIVAGLWMIFQGVREMRS